MKSSVDSTETLEFIEDTRKTDKSNKDLGVSSGSEGHNEFSSESLGGSPLSSSEKPDTDHSNSMSSRDSKHIKDATSEDIAKNIGMYFV